MGCFSMPKGVPNKRYTGEFKQLVVETMMRDKLSYREAARQFEVPDHKDVAKWERYYLTDGPEGLYIERRGRSSKGRPQQFPKELEEDLLKEVQRLRAENACNRVPSIRSEAISFPNPRFVQRRHCDLHFVRQSKPTDGNDHAQASI